VSYVLLFFRIVSSVVILLFACSALVVIILVMELASVAEQVSINASAATMVPTAPNAKAGTTSTTPYANLVLKMVANCVMLLLLETVLTAILDIIYQAEAVINAI
jgi:hypothetical protein